MIKPDHHIYISTLREKKMLKIKDSVKLAELDEKYNLDTEVIDGDYEYESCCDCEHWKDGVFISENIKRIFGIDNSDLDFLYVLIQEGLVEKEEEK